MSKVITNNQVTIVGEIVSSFEYSHEIFGEGFYTSELLVKRLGDTCDVVPFVVSDRLIDVTKDYTGIKVKMEGQFRSFNRHEENKHHLILSMFVRKLEFVDEIEDRKANVIFLDGFICKPPVYRTTPLGREIADVFLAVNRAYGKSDYIPCICWGRNAKFAGELAVGNRIQVYGRIQSREYIKKLSEEKSETRVAYEVSVHRLELVEE